MRSKIVHDDDVTWPEGWDEDLCDIEQEALAIDRPLDEPWRHHAIVSQSGDEGEGLPAALRDFGQQTLAARCPAAQRGHIGLGPGLIDEDQAGRIDPLLIGPPLDPPAGDVLTIPLLGDQRLFL